MKRLLSCLLSFLASLTVPDNEMWVNLSPVESDRIIAEGLGQTLMGRDLLVQDYLLKQLTASLMNPETESGKKFWDRVYQTAGAIHELPLQDAVETFNKVWIVPSKAVIYEHGTSAFIVENHLNVMLEEDYLGKGEWGMVDNNKPSTNRQSPSTKEIIRQTILPLIEKEVNEGETFTNLRQIYNAMLLATWYKRNLKKSILSQVYIDQNKIQGVESGEADAIDKIYNQYVASFKAGAASLIKEDYDPATQQTVARQYFTGGAKNYLGLDIGIQRTATIGFSPAQLGKSPRVVSWAMLGLDSKNAAMMVDSEAGELDDAMLLVVDPVAYPQYSALKGKVITLQGVGNVGGLLIEPLLHAGVTLIASDVDPVKVRDAKEKYARFIESGQMFVFAEESLDGGFSNKIMNPLAYFPDLKSQMGIEAIDFFVPAAVGRVVSQQTIPMLKAAGVKAIIGSANDVLQDRSRDSQTLHTEDILLIPDYVSNFGGVFGVDAFLLNQPVTNSLVVETARRNIGSLLDSMDGQIPLAVADRHARDFFDALPRQENRRLAEVLDGDTMPDGTIVKVFTSKEDLPEEIQSRWDDHYAVFELKNEALGYTAYMAIHRLTLIQSGQSDILRNQYRATGGTRMRNYPLDEKALEDALELSKEMSFKTAGAGLPIGGSKCAINVAIDPKDGGADHERRQQIIVSYAKAIEYIGKQIGGGVLTGQDMNISVKDAKRMFVNAPTSIVPYVSEFSIEPTPPTSVGVYNAIGIVAEHLANSAMVVSQPQHGGIDLDGSKTEIEIQGQGQGFEFDIDPAMLERLQSRDFKFNPVIINIQPFINSPLYSQLFDQKQRQAADESPSSMDLTYLKED